METGELGPKRSSINDDSIDDDDFGFGKGYKTEIENVILGKHMPVTMARSGSEVSVQHSERTALKAARQHLLGNHPLLIEKPEEWNNIPIPMTDAIINIIKTILQSDESLFEY